MKLFPALASLAVLAGMLAPRAPRVLSQPEGADAAEIARVLDDFHDAAAKGDEERYFAHFTPDAVFLGTDPTERWPLAEFRAWAAPYFERESAWTYHAVERHVSVEGEAAWFDEVVRNANYGDLRGTGVLVRRDGAWRIAQYNLTFQVPNDLADELVKRIRSAAPREP